MAMSPFHIERNLVMPTWEPPPNVGVLLMRQAREAAGNWRGDIRQAIDLREDLRLGATSADRRHP